MGGFGEYGNIIDPKNDYKNGNIKNNSDTDVGFSKFEVKPIILKNINNITNKNKKTDLFTNNSTIKDDLTQFGQAITFISNKTNNTTNNNKTENNKTENKTNGTITDKNTIDQWIDDHKTELIIGTVTITIIIIAIIAWKCGVFKAISNWLSDCCGQDQEYLLKYRNNENELLSYHSQLQGQIYQYETKLGIRHQTFETVNMENEFEQRNLKQALSGSLKRKIKRTHANIAPLSTIHSEELELSQGHLNPS